MQYVNQVSLGIMSTLDDATFHDLRRMPSFSANVERSEDFM